MVRAAPAFQRQKLAGERAQAAFHPVADHGAADFPGDGEANANCRVAVGTVADQEDEAWRRCPPAGVGGEEIGPLSKRD